MVKMSFRFRNLGNITQKLANLPPKVEREVDLALYHGSKRIETRARQKAAVDTGFMESSIFADNVAPLHYKVEAFAPYSKFVEFGTRHMMAQPFIRPAYFEERERIRSEIRLAVRRGMQ